MKFERDKGSYKISFYMCYSRIFTKFWVIPISVVHDSAKWRSIPHSTTGNNYNYSCRDINNDNNSH